MNKRNYKLLACALLAANIGITGAVAHAANDSNKGVVSTVTGSNDEVNAQLQTAAKEVNKGQITGVKISGSNTGTENSEAVAKMQAWNATRPTEENIASSDSQYNNLTVVSVDVVGNNIIPKDQIQQVIKMRAGDKFSKELVEQARKDLYYTGYFYDNYPTFVKVPEGVKVTFHVMENPVLHSVKITGNKVMSTKQIESMLQGVTIGQILNTRVLNEDLAKVENVYHENGYILAKIQNINLDESGNLDIAFNEGILEGYEVRGNDKTRTKVILREMRMKPGQVFNANLARRSMQRIYNLGFFDDINVRLLPGKKNPNDVIMELTVTEKRTGTFGIGAGYSSEDGFVGTVSIADTNFRGMGDAIRASYEFGGKDSRGYNLSYTRPWLDKKETSGTVRFYNRTYNYDEYNNKGNNVMEYKRHDKGYELSLGRPINEYTTNILGLRLGDVAYDGYKGGLRPSLTAEAFPKSQNPQAEANAYNSAMAAWKKANFGKTNSISFSQIHDTRDNIYFPTTGSRYSTTLEKAGILGGDFSYWKFTGTAQKYYKVGRSQVVAVRGSIGYGKGDMPTASGFQVGGQNSVRGYKDGQFAGNKMLMANAEYRFPIAKKIQGAFFVDAGDAWGGAHVWDKYFDNKIETKLKVHSSVGLGIQMETPIGPLRLDYAWGQQGGKAHFNIGGSF